MQKLYDIVKNELKTELLPFWNNLIDLEEGGFYGEVTYDLEVKKLSPKGGIATARILWTYARAYGYLEDPTLKKYMNHAYEFLKNSIVDKTSGGLFWSVEYNGEILDDRKHVYAQSFGIYSLSEYYKVTKNKEALDLCMSLFKLTEDKGFDLVLGAYLEEFDREWKPQTNEMLSENGISAHLTMNTHLHILEAYTNLYRVNPTKEVENALAKVLDIFKKHIYNDEKGYMDVFFNDQWESIIELNSFGHDIEASWLIQEAVDVLGLKDETIEGIIHQLGENILGRALMADGSVLNEIENDIIEPTRIWWTQAEAMVGFLNMYQRLHEPIYLEAVENVWSYIMKNLKDERDNSEWFWGKDVNGLPVKMPIVGLWKTPYHNLRSCIEVLTRLDQLMEEEKCCTKSIVSY